MIATLRHLLAARRALAGLTLRDLEAHGTLDRSSYQRFEHGGGARDIDAVVSAYAAALGTTPQALWTDTLALYIRDPAGERGATALRGRRAVSSRSTD